MRLESSISGSIRNFLEVAFFICSRLGLKEAQVAAYYTTANKLWKNATNRL